jgi:hypothetical protein
MGAGLSIAKIKLQQDIKKALKEGFMATFLMGPVDDGEEMANKFADKAAGPMADAIMNFVSQAKISGIQSNVATVISTPVGGPCTGVLTFNGTELSLS